MLIIPPHHPLHRRSFLHATGKLAAAAAVLPATLLAQTPSRHEPPEQHEQDDDVSANEDLMREHGILKRVLLIYGEVIGRIDAKQDFPPQTVIDSAQRELHDYRRQQGWALPLDLRHENEVRSFCEDLKSKRLIDGTKSK